MLYGRVYQLIAGVGGSQNAALIDNLRCTFDIYRDAGKNPNQSTIKVYNVSPETRGILETPNIVCEFRAGYELEAGPILLFSGNVTFAFTADEGPESVTTLELADGFTATRDTVMSASYAAGVSSERVIRDCAAQMGLGVDISADVVHQPYPHKFAHAGAARNVLTKACAHIGAEWSIQSGQIRVVKRGQPMKQEAFVFSADSGLIGSPTREREASKSAGKTNDITTTRERGGWSIKTLLCPTLQPGDPVRIESKAVTAFCRIENVQHSGDTHGGDWVSIFKANQIE